MQISDLYDLFRASSGVCTDTRKIQKDQLFFALKGANFDGNRFVDLALTGGCKAAVVDDPALAKQEGCILVPDVLTALQEVARHHRRQMQAKIIGLTGSNGKTSSKELLNAVLSTTYPTYATKGNLNNHIGVPLSLLEIREDHAFAVIEMGANAQGEIAELSGIAEPDFGVITNIGKAHLEGFGGLAGVKKGKRELFDFLKGNDGVAFVNAADPLLLEVSEGMHRELYGTDVHSPEVYLVQESPTLKFAWSHHAYFCKEVSTHLTGTYNLNNIATAIAVGRYFHVEPEKINEAIASYVPSNHRSQIMETEHNTLILDAYNANPSSMEEALRSFASFEGANKCCVLGDMFELGSEAKAEHLRVRDLASSLGFKIFLVGKHFEEIAEDEDTVFPSTEALEAHMRKEPLRGCTILLKGSRGMQLERLIPLL